jgi:hypothetical protein
MVARAVRFPTFFAVLVAAACLAPPAGARSAASELPTLYVNYALNCTFTITGDSGQTITSIAPGEYEIDITTPEPFAEVDLSGATGMTACQSYVQFQLSGPGVNVTSTLMDGDSAFALLQATFQPGGTYTAVDNNQPTVARDVFTTATSGAPVAPANPSASSTSVSKGTPSQDLVGSAVPPLRGSLEATVYADGKVQLVRNGNAFTSLKEGQWTFSIDDESSKAGFSVQLLHGKTTTISSKSYVGSNDVTVTLKPGRWFYFTPGGKKKQFFVTG